RPMSAGSSCLSSERTGGSEPPVFLLMPVTGAQAQGGNLSAISSPTVTGFTGFVLSRTVDADDAGGVADDGAVDDGVAVGASSLEVAAGVAAVAAAGGSCGVDGDATREPSPPLGARQSMISRWGRVFIPNAVFIGRRSRFAIGYTYSPRSMRITATCSSRFV